VHARRVKTVCENGLICVAALQRFETPDDVVGAAIACRRAQIQIDGGSPEQFRAR
jgi:hypothetical protein